MNTVFGIIVGLVVLMLLVVAHEFGHFLMAKKNGVKVNEFGIGFPPKAIAWVRNPEYDKWKKERKKRKKVLVNYKNSSKSKTTSLKITKDEYIPEKPKKWLRLPKSEWNKPQKTLIFSINWLPIGGFCAMDGESDSDTRKGTFGAASFWGKTKILFGGVTANWIIAFIILTILSLFGMPHLIENQFALEGDTIIEAKPVVVSEVIEDSPADKAGFKVKDTIYKVGGEDIYSGSQIITYNKEHAGEEVVFSIERDGKSEEIKVKLNSADAAYLLGVSMSQTGQTLYRSTWSAPIVGLVTTVQLTGETFRGLWNMVWSFGSGVVKQFSADEGTRQEGQTAIKAAGDSVSGPVGMIGILFPAFTEAGPINLAFLAALISVSLACMNVLPIPALDGGRWFLIAIYRMRGKTLDKETEEKIVTRAFIALLILIALITVLDITRFF